MATRELKTTKAPSMYYTTTIRISILLSIWNADCFTLLLTSIR